MMILCKFSECFVSTEALAWRPLNRKEREDLLAAGPVLVISHVPDTSVAMKRRLLGLEPQVLDYFSEPQIFHMQNGHNNSNSS